MSAAGEARAHDVESYFNDLARAVDNALVAGERHATWFSAEDSDFVRMNRGKVRQPGTVSQRFIDIRLIRGARHASHSLSLSGDLHSDARAIGAAVAGLRDVLPQLADDPHLLLPTTVASSRTTRGATLPPTEAIVARMLDAAAGLDLVGLAAAGPVYRGFANSDGQRNWHVVTTFNLQWSLYHRADKAVKASYSDVAWSDAALDERMRASIEQFRLISAPPKALRPGKYRAYLAPAAMQEIVELLAWGGFSARGLETQQSALSRMRVDARLDPRVQIVEDYAAGVAPPFQAEGFARPGSVPLVVDGRLSGALVSPRDRARIRARCQWRQRRRIARSAVDRRRHGRGARCARRARHGTRRRQPVVPQLFRPSRVPDDRDDAFRDVLGRGREGRGTGRRAALRRYPVSGCSATTSKR